MIPDYLFNECDRKLRTNLLKLTIFSHPIVPLFILILNLTMIYGFSSLFSGSQRRGKETGGTGDQKKNRDNPGQSTTKISQNT